MVGAPFAFAVVVAAGAGGVVGGLAVAVAVGVEIVLPEGPVGGGRLGCVFQGVEGGARATAPLPIVYPRVPRIGAQRV